jgi:hypothetical protein
MARKTKHNKPNNRKSLMRQKKRNIRVRTLMIQSRALTKNPNLIMTVNKMMIIQMTKILILKGMNMNVMKKAGQKES